MSGYNLLRSWMMFAEGALPRLHSCDRPKYFSFLKIHANGCSGQVKRLRIFYSGFWAFGQFYL
jgi:hypothetical protein